MNATNGDSSAKALFDAIVADDHAVVSAILDNDPSVVAAHDGQGDTPLHCAVRHSDKRMIRLLLFRGADVCGVDAGGKSPLHVASQNGCIWSIEMLLKAGAQGNARDFEGRTPLHGAVLRNRYDAVEALLLANVDINAIDLLGRTPLHLATWGESDDVVRLLIEWGASVVVRDNDGKSPLHEATCGRPTVVEVELLLAAGAPLDSIDADGNTPLLLAAYLASIEVVGRLLSVGANPNHANIGANTALSMAATREDPMFVAMLLANGADVDFEASVPLHLAASLGRLENIRLLIDHGVNVNRRDEAGRTSLMIAMAEGQLDVAEYLKAHGASG